MSNKPEPMKPKQLAIHSTIDHLIPDSNNANKGTKRGQWMLEQSVKVAGIGRGIVTDSQGNIIAGNQTTATVEALGYEDVIVVPTDGKTLVVTQRNDLDLSAAPETEAYQRARALAVADNRSGEINLSWDEAVLDEYHAEGVIIEDWWKPEEYTPGAAVQWADNSDAGEDPEDTDDSGFSASDDDDDEGPEEEVFEKQKPERQGQVVPLAIALTSSQLKEWNIIKESAGLVSDTRVFLKLMYGEL